MVSRQYKFAASIALLLGSTASIALPFNSFDPRSMAMGGAGVAVSNAATAPLFNPALLSTTRYSDFFSLTLPSAGIRVADPEDLVKSADAFQAGNYVTSLETSITSLDSASTAATTAASAAATAADAAATAITLANTTLLPADIAAALAATAVAATATATAATSFATVSTASSNAATSLNNVSSGLARLSDKPISIDGGLAIVVGIPHRKYGAAFLANRTIAIGGAFQYRDATTLTTLANTATCFSQASAAAATAATNLSSALSVSPPVAADVTTASAAVTAAQDAITACGTPTFTSDNLLSGVNIKGVMLTEMGFSMSGEYYINRQRVALGITPKIVQAQIYEIPLSVNSSISSASLGDDYVARYSLPNFDLGAAQNYRNGWRAGLVVKNVIPYVLYFKNAPSPGTTPVETGSTLRLMPQTRIGISHTNRWSTVALDADVYRNNPVGLDNYTQYISLGGELNAWNWAQLRAGYRADLVNSARNIVSFGLGFSPFGIHADIALAGNEREYGAAFQLGLHF